MKILIIEDDKTKSEKLFNLLDNHEVELRESFQSGINELKINQYQLLILDMTIPLWDRNNNDINQNYEQFGGERILREMKRKKINVPVILFTMFDKFPQEKGLITFAEINEIYKNQFEFYVDGIYYDSINNSWKEKLLNSIRLINES